MKTEANHTLTLLEADGKFIRDNTGELFAECRTPERAGE